VHHIEPIARAVEALASLPGIGPKTAQRLTFHLLRQPPETVRDLAQAIVHMKESVHFCSVCGNVTDVDPCSICRSDQRDRAMICVVEDPLAVMTLERTRIYKGLYHVLHGALDPLHGVTVEDLKIEELVRRVDGPSRAVARRLETCIREGAGHVPVYSRRSFKQ
jgi:recombination protein RecR